MKKNLRNTFFIGTLTLLGITGIKAQTVSTFETLVLPVDSFWNGAETPNGSAFADGNAIFKNLYKDYWLGGFAYSNKKDTTTAGFTNLYAARTGSGYGGSGNYAVGQQDAVILLKGAAAGKPVSGVYITNSTYAALSMKNGDSFSKKFGGATGSDPDWFKLTITKYYQGNPGSNSVSFYLADFRSADNTQDYIVSNWRWVDLTSLGNADSLKFILTSSDLGNFGINTPTFFCIDNFTTSDKSSKTEALESAQISLSIYPNPANEQLTVKLPALQAAYFNVAIIDITGRLVYSTTANGNFATLPTAHLQPGMYTIKVTGTDFIGTKSFIKQQ